MFQIEVKERTDALRSIVERCFFEYAPGFYFSCEASLLQQDGLPQEIGYNQHRYACVVYDARDGMLKCRSGGIPFKRLCEMVLAIYQQENAVSLGDEWPHDPAAQLKIMQEYVKNILKTHQCIRKVVRHCAYFGYHYAVTLCHKTSRDTQKKEIIDNDYFNCFEEQCDHPYSSLYQLDDHLFEESQGSFYCYMYDAAFDLNSGKRIPKAEQHPSLLPPVPESSLPALLPKTKGNWFLLSKPLSTQNALYFFPCSQTIQSPRIRAVHGHYFIAWHTQDNQLIDHIQLIPAALPRPDEASGTQLFERHPTQSVHSHGTLSHLLCEPSCRILPVCESDLTEWVRQKNAAAFQQYPYKLTCPRSKEQHHVLAILTQQPQGSTPRKEWLISHENNTLFSKIRPNDLQQYGVSPILKGEELCGIYFQNLMKKDFSFFLHQKGNNVLDIAICYP